MKDDFLDELGELALGSRLKRLSERMLADASGVYEHFGMDVQPKWFTLLALLHRKKQVSVVQASEYLGLSQPAISQFCRQLVDKKLMAISTDASDSRRKIMCLTSQGEKQITAMLPVWKAVHEAAEQLCTEFENDFYPALQKFESALQQKSLLQRTLEAYEKTDPITILPFSTDLAEHFDIINREWIESMFVLEQVDKMVLENPQQEIIDKGGYIWFAVHESLGVVGTCALMKKAEGTFELTKMGVLASARGLKVGEQLLKYVIDWSVENNLEYLFLLTNSKCEAAIHLYEKNGFVHDKGVMESFGKSYERCNVAMLYSPGKPV